MLTGRFPDASEGDADALLASYQNVLTDVIDERLNRIGRVVDVMGPTERPYLVVTPESGEPPAALLNEPVYVR